MSKAGGNEREGRGRKGWEVEGASLRMVKTLSKEGKTWSGRIVDEWCEGASLRAAICGLRWDANVESGPNYTSRVTGEKISEKGRL